LFISIPFLVFSIILSKGKGASLLTGYNTLSDSEKAEYDEIALCKCMGKIMYGIRSSIMLIAFAGYRACSTAYMDYFCMCSYEYKRQIQKENMIE